MRTRLMTLAAFVALAATSASARDIARRTARQEGRIANGVATGSLSPREAGRLQRQENALQQQEQAMRAANGGHLTPGERRLVTREQNGLSRRIWRQKHDGNGA